MIMVTLAWALALFQGSTLPTSSQIQEGCLEKQFFSNFMGVADDINWSCSAKIVSDKDFR